MKPRDYCCCAIPTANAGIYAVLTEQLVLGILLGALSMATPSIVGAATPSFAPWVFGIVCFVAGAAQILGFIGVAKEKPILFRRYSSIHLVLTLAAFALGATWAAISASRHSTAMSKCIKDFYDLDDPAQKSESEILCNIFPWVDVGIMGGVWILLAAVHIYFYVVMASFSSGQQVDRAKYDALNDSVNPVTSDSIPMDSRGAWGERHERPGYGHMHKESAASMSDVMNQPVHQPRDGFNYNTYPQQSADGYDGYDDALSAPRQAYTNDPGPTPKFSNAIYGGPSTMDAPPQVQSHPAEGSFGRKTPRLI